MLTVRNLLRKYPRRTHHEKIIIIRSISSGSHVIDSLLIAEIYINQQDIKHQNQLTSPYVSEFTRIS